MIVAMKRVLQIKSDVVHPSSLLCTCLLTLFNYRNCVSSTISEPELKKSLFGNLCFLLILSADGNCCIVFILFTLVYSVLVPSQRRNGLIPRLIHALEFKRFVWFDFRSKSNYLLLAVGLILQHSCRFFHFMHLFFDKF